MLSLKLAIKSCSNKPLLGDYISNYTGLYYKLYNNPDLMEDKDFTKSQLNSYIDKSIYDFCEADVKTRLEQHITDLKKKSERISSIEKILSEKSFRNKKVQFKLTKTLNNLKKNLGKNVCFGSKALLRKITKSKQTLINIKKFESTNFSEIVRLNVQIAKYKTEFTLKRRVPIYLVGRACEKGNRKIEFDFPNNHLTFKPSKGVKIEFEFYIKPKQKQILLKLQELADLKLIPLTVLLKEDSISILYDNEKMNGYEFKKLDYVKALKKENPKTKEEKNLIFRDFKNEQANRKLEGKIKSRSCSVDLNPLYIGFTIIEEQKNGDEIVGTPKVLHHETISLKGLSKKLGLSSDHPKVIKQNNKRKHEIKESFISIFRLCKHYKIYNFCMEDLDFKIDKKEEGNKEFHRQTKNLWYRNLIEQLIVKNCENEGLNLIKGDPWYTSFIGNLIYTLPDPEASSLMIWYRCIGRYKKGFKVYPSINLIRHEKLNYLHAENILVDGMSWKQLYKNLSEQRYRNPIPCGIGIDKNLSSYKSKVKRIINYVP